MAKYKLQENGVLDTETGASIPDCGGNKDWQEYLTWVDGGNTPDPEFTQEEIDAQQLQNDLEVLDTNMASSIASAAICEVNGTTYEMDGSEQASIRMKNGIDLAEMLGETTINIIDYHNQVHTDVSIDDAKEILKLQGQFYRNAYYTRANDRATLLGS